MKHTQGEWTREDNSIVGQRYVCELSDWHIVAAGGQYDAINQALTEERDANARLIAAAPELLEACKAVLPYIENVARTAHGKNPECWGAYHNLAGLIDAAIAKAGGQQ
jgi:hypothetical protein